MIIRPRQSQNDSAGAFYLPAGFESQGESGDGLLTHCQQVHPDPALVLDARECMAKITDLPGKGG